MKKSNDVQLRFAGIIRQRLPFTVLYAARGGGLYSVRAVPRCGKTVMKADGQGCSGHLPLCRAGHKAQMRMKHL